MDGTHSAGVAVWRASAELWQGEGTAAARPLLHIRCLMRDAQQLLAVDGQPAVRTNVAV